ncbi:hypothetical protein NMY22_g13939 [Coprinellus aureogranulatus]|nr:hypothetical protein NMY22_g13939 [Coprinellus aureogranulatus]
MRPSRREAALQPWNGHAASRTLELHFLKGVRFLLSLASPDHHSYYLRSMPDEDIPLLRLSIDGFVDLLRELNEDGRTEEFIRLALTGRFEDQQVVVDALESSMNQSEHSSDEEGDSDDEGNGYNVSRDFDSALGISDGICIFGKIINFHILPKWTDSLTKDVGITYPIRCGDVVRQVDLHRIANFGFGRWGERNELRLFLPGLFEWGVRESHHISMDELELLWTAIRRTVKSLLPTNRGDNLPPNISSESFRARASNGTLHFSTRVMDEESAAQFGDCLRAAIEDAIDEGKDLEWARGFFFLHQIRGVKDGHPHAPHQSRAAFEAFLETHGLSRTALRANPDRWWFDIGVEISSSNGKYSLAWRADSHYHILVRFAQLLEHHARRLTSLGSTLYVKDFTSHLVDVAGGRIDTGSGPAQGPLHIIKVQLYQTDKSLTATPAGGPAFHAKHVTLSQLIDKENPAFFDSLYSLYTSAEKSGIVSNARFEVRLPYRYHHKFYTREVEGEWKPYLVRIHRDTWWALRYMPIIAYKSVVDYQFSAPPEIRTNLRAVTLLAAIVWLTNSLHATPDTGPSSRQLLSVVLPLVPRDEISEGSMPYRIARRDRQQLDGDMGFDEHNRMDPEEAATAGGAFANQRGSTPEIVAYPFPQRADRDEDLVPAYLYGHIFLNGISFDAEHPAPIMAGGNGFLSERTFKYMYGADFGAFRNFVFSRETFVASNPRRSRNRVRQLAYIPPEDDPIPNYIKVRNGDQTIPGMGFGDAAGDSDDEDAGERVSVDDFSSKLFHQLLIDLFSVAPNKRDRNKGCHCRVRREEAHLVTEAYFKDKNLAKYFKRAHIKRASDAEWTTMLYHLLPPRDAPPKSRSSQNYGKCAYYSMWDHLKRNVAHQVFDAVREEIQKRIFKFQWMPWAQSDKIWLSKGDKNSRSPWTPSPRLEKGKPAPFVICRGAWQWDMSSVTVRSDDSE